MPSYETKKIPSEPNTFSAMRTVYDLGEESVYDVLDYEYCSNRRIIKIINILPFVTNCQSQSES